MSSATLEERVAALEHQVAALQVAVQQGGRSKDWRRTVGMFTGDELMKRIDEQARKFREADRQKARRRPNRSKQ
jgi:hypothetical protein